MLIYSGMGVLGIIVPGAFGTGGYFLLRGWGFGVMGVGFGIIVGSVLTQRLAHQINKQEEGAAGGLYGISLETWCWVPGIIGAVIVLRSILHAAGL